MLVLYEFRNFGRFFTDGIWKINCSVLRIYSKETLWGGHRILPFKGLKADERLIGESWELSGIPGNESVVAGGAYDGMTLTQLAEKGGSALLGEENFKRFGTRFPLLIKFIDAAQPLSVQVHPDDELAQRRHGCPGQDGDVVCGGRSTGSLSVGWVQPAGDSGRICGARGRPDSARSAPVL